MDGLRVYIANLGSTRAGGPMGSFQPDLAMLKLEWSIGEGALEANGLASKVCSALESTDLLLLVKCFKPEKDDSLDLEGRGSLRSFVVVFSLYFLINLALNLESLF